MKVHNIFKSILALSLAVVVVSSCQEKNNGGGSFTKGEAVKFSVGTAGSGTDTKAAYSGDVTGTTTKLERIDWQAGDMIRIYCAQASEPESHFADYIVNAVEEGSGAVSKAKIQQWGLEDKGLRWSETSAEHKFYAVYPSPLNVDRQVVRTEDVFPGPDGNETTMTGNIPATQKPVSLNKDAAATEPNFTAVADLSSEYMVAYASVAAGTQTVDGGVFLNFKPIVTAIEFTISNGFTTEGKLNIVSIQLESASNNIAGTFTADLTGLAEDGSKYPICTSTVTGKTVTMDFTDIPGYDYSGNAEVSGSKKYITLTKGQSLRFTVFLKPNYNSDTPAKPVDIDDITFRINKAEGTWMSTRLGYTDGSGVVFPTHKKTTVKGILVPEGAQWTVNYGSLEQSTLVVSKWNIGIDDELALLEPYNGHEYVDLDLPSGLKWATMNVGATKPEDCGLYFAWGDIVGQTAGTTGEGAFSTPFDWEHTPFNNGSSSYNGTYFIANKSNWISGVDKLKPEYDVAHVKWGGLWRMPTKDDFEELIENTDNEWTNYSGVDGYIFTSKTDSTKSIFLPVSGFGFNSSLGNPDKDGNYWSSSLKADAPSNASMLYFGSGSVLTYLWERCQGMPIRPVVE